VARALWIGGQDPHGQWDLREVPELPAAQRRHTKLVRQHGRAPVQAAHNQAVHVTAWWAQHGCWSDDALARRRVLTGLADGIPHDRDPIIALLYYPETVGLLSLFVSPYWTRILGQQPRRELLDSPLTRRFHAEVRRRTGYDITDVVDGGGRRGATRRAAGPVSPAVEPEVARRPHDPSGQRVDRERAPVKQVLHLGDRVRYQDLEYRVVALTGTHLRLTGPDDTTIAVLLTHLLTSDGFALLDAEPALAVVNPRLDDLDAATADLARQWEQHITEVETGLPLDAGPDAQPRPEYDPATTTLTQRCQAKARELSALGWQASARTIARMRQRLRTTGDPRALTDGRSRRPINPTGATDPRVVEVIRHALQAEIPDSTGTRDRFRWRVQQIIADRYPDDPPPLPAKSTFNKLLRTMTTGGYTFDAAVTRRNMNNRPAGGLPP
jgi:hypothetical protein